MNSFNMGSIEAWVPRGLVINGAHVLSAPITQDGLCPLRISWEKNKITRIEVLNDYSKKPLNLVLPRLVEPHTHIDKIFTWEQYPNLSGTYEGALEANINEHQKRTSCLMRSRSEKALQLGLRNGLRAIRSHIDSFGIKGMESWQVIMDLKNEWKSLIDLQCVAMVPLDYWNTREGELLATKVANSDGLLGGIIVPPFNKKKSIRDLIEFFKLANRLNCGIDLHIDESTRDPGAGLSLLIQLLECMEVNVPITCSHSSSMGLLPKRKLRYLAEKLAHHQIHVIALPLTNFWLLGHDKKETPNKRPLAPIKQLQQAGVNVAVGGDNVQDPWFPLGSLDPIALMSLSMPLTQLSPWERLGLSPFTTSAAVLMDLEWDGSIQIGSPAEFIMLQASSWIEALSTSPSREILIKGEWFQK